MANILKAKGLYTNYNDLSAVPTGALIKADNINVDRDDIIEPRRGIGRFDSTPDLDNYIKQLMVYKGRILRHTENKLQIDDNGEGNFVDLSAVHTEVESYLRTKFIEVQGNLYFTSNTGIKKISEVNASTLNASTEVYLAGIPLSLDLQATVKHDIAGFLPAQSKVAYRLIYGRNDNNNIPHLGAPGDRIIVGNSSAEQGTYQFQQYDINTDVKGQISSTLTNDSYIHVNSANNERKYVIGYKASDTDAISGFEDNKERIQILVDIRDTAYTTADQYASLTVNAIKANSFASEDFNVYSSDSTIYFENLQLGSCDAITSPDGNFVTSVTKYGSKLNSVSATVQIQSPIPSEILNAEDPSTYYYQLYRSQFVEVTDEVSFDSLSPSDEMNLVYESNITSTDETNGYVTISDNYTESLRLSALPLYTNAFSGDGSVQGNYRPPVSADIENYNNITWYANTKSDHRLNIDLLGLDNFVYYINAYQIKQSRLQLYLTSTPPADLSGNIKISGVPGVDPTIAYPIQIVYAEGNYPYIRINANPNPLLPTSYTPLEVFGTIRKNEDKYLSVTKGLSTKDYILDGINSIRKIDLDIGNSPITFRRTAVNVIQMNFSVPHGLSVDDYIFLYSDSTSTIGTGVFKITSSVGNSVEFASSALVTPNILDPAVTIDVGIISSNTIWKIDAANDKTQYYVFFDFTGNTEAPINDLTDSRLPIRIDMTQVSTVAQFWTAVRSAVNSTGDIHIESPTTTLSPFSSIARIIRTENGPVTTVFESENLVLASADIFAAELLSITTGDQDGDVTLSSGYDGEALLSRKLTAEVNELTARSLVHAINGDVDGDIYAYYVSSATDLPGKMEFVSRVTDNTEFSVTMNPVGLRGNFSPNVNNTKSTNEVKPNRIYYSKIDKPEAVSPANYLDVGAQDKAIRRILALRDNLFVLKDDGIYTISTFGGVPSVRLLDKSVFVTVADSAAVLNNTILCLSSQGIVQIGVSGVQIVSRHFENLLNDITYKLDYTSNTFAVSYEADKAYLLFMPSLIGDTSATQAFRYNVFSNSWTRWTIPANCGIVNPDDKKLYLGYGVDYFVVQERKNGTRTDYSDLDYTGNILSENSQEISMSNVVDVEVTDALVQYQYVTINKFNSLLLKLDLDPLSDMGYEALSAVAGNSLYSKLNSLIDKIHLHIGASPIAYATVNDTIEQLRVKYNEIIAVLNNKVSYPNKYLYSDYKLIDTSDLTYTEGLVIKKYTYLAKVELNYSDIPFWAGEVIISKGIKSDVAWAPDAFGVPEKMKQITSGSIIFSGNQFYGASFGFASDLSKDYEFVDFVGFGSGAFGLIPFGNNTFGGEGNDVPFRTIVPLEKQRCRYIYPRFKHQYSRELFRILGYSFNPRIVSERAYRDK